MIVFVVLLLCRYDEEVLVKQEEQNNIRENSKMAVKGDYRDGG